MVDEDQHSAVASTDEATRASLKLWVVLARAYRSVAESVRRDIEDRGLGVTEFAVLELLYHKGPLSLGKVAERVLLTSGSMTYVIDKLEHRGLLARRACAEDRRVCYAEITDAGRALVADILPVHAEAVRRITSGLSTAEKRTASALLERLGLAAHRGG